MLTGSGLAAGLPPSLRASPNLAEVTARAELLVPVLPSHALRAYDHTDQVGVCMGDLVLTCTGDLSRNRRVGLALGRGRSLDDILAELGEVAEGVLTTRSAYHLSQQLGVEMPITQQMHAMLYQGQPGSEVLGMLLGRARRTEREH